MITSIMVHEPYVECGIKTLSINTAHYISIETDNRVKLDIFFNSTESLKLFLDKLNADVSAITKLEGE